MGPKEAVGIGDVVYIRIGEGSIPMKVNDYYVEHDFRMVYPIVHLKAFVAEDTDIPNKQPGVIKKVIYNPPATIIFWADGTKTVVKCMEGDEFDPEKGLAIGIAQKFVPKKEIKKWLPKNWELPEEEIPDLTGGTWHPGLSTDYDLTATVPLKEDDSNDKKPSFLGNAFRDLTDIFKSAVKGE